MVGYSRFLIGLFGVWVFSVFAAEPAVMPLVRKLYTVNSAMEAQFELKTYWSVREKEETKAGKLSIAPQNRFRVEVGNDLLVSDGQTYWQYSKKTAQVIIKNFSDLDLQMHPSQLLSTFLTNYEYVEKSNSNGVNVLSWNADSENKGGYTAIEVSVESKTGEVKVLKLTDRNGNIQTYSFKKTVFGAKFSQKVFTFEVPQDAQVLDNR